MGILDDAEVRYYVVGSSLHSDSPHDLDMVGILSDEDFERFFGMNQRTLQDELRDYRASRKTTPRILRYQHRVEGARIILESMFPYRKVDFHFLPRCLLYEPNEEINLYGLDEWK